MVKLGLLGAQTGFDVAQAAAISELSEQQAKELIPTREVFDVTIALVAVDANLKLVGGEEIQELSENGSAKIHLLSPMQNAKQQNHAEKGPKN
jgi:hypothetical protein